MFEFLDDPAIRDEIEHKSGQLIGDHYRMPFGYRTRRSKGSHDWLITFTLSGEGVFKIGGDILPCMAGDLVMLPPGTPHLYATQEGCVWEFVWVHVVPLPDWSGLLQLPRTYGGLVYSQIGEEPLRQRLLNAFERAIHDSRELKGFSAELAMTAVEEILLLVNQQQWQTSKRAMDPRVSEVLHALMHRMSEAHSVAALARSVNLSPSRLAHMFKEQVGESIIDTLNKIRLRQAALLLRFTPRQVGEVARDVGFQDPFYFTKQFKAFYGINPSQYRSQSAPEREGELE
ncbi:helix-turn-helix domain-containing protein [Paenibacillus sp. MBLB4367]|uniref:helix-turn-helix domain-containing protein n=1 Tax=Paenibacillus sp. MBLB4367 TaxID=3384767 RepID=UPI003908008B